MRSFHFAKFIDAFGKISPGCTATHIGNGIVLTAGHCFSAPSFEATNLACDETEIQWGIRGSTEPYLTSKCIRILSMTDNKESDYAILKVDPAPETFIEVDLSSRPEIDTDITIFGHPMQRPLEWSGYCKVRPNTHSPHAGEKEFCHQCDTEPGNSGSTILAVNSLKVVGIHNGGISPWNYATYIIDTPVMNYLKECNEEELIKCLKDEDGESCFDTHCSL